MSTVYEKLLNIQSEIKCNKSQFNSFGKYNYRSVEDIMEAIKPLLTQYKATLTVKDDIVLIGDRYYVKATATFIDIETGESIENTAFAREEEDFKGMAKSQVTGSTSSYARKYCLGGLLLLDDTKDADALNTHDSNASKNNYTPHTELTDSQVKRLYTIANKVGYKADKLKELINKKYNKEIKELTKSEYDYICNSLQRK